MTTAQENGARRMESSSPPTDRRNDPSIARRERIRKRRTIPAGALKVRGNPGRVLHYLWDRAPWSQGPVAFVWPTVETIAAELGLAVSSAYAALRRLRELGWIYRETRSVRWAGCTVQRYGWVLEDEPSAGPLFAPVEREGRDGDLEVDPPSFPEGDPPSFPESPSYTGTGNEPYGSSRVCASACAREPGEDDDDEVGHGTQVAPADPPTLPQPDPETTALWEAHERERATALRDVRRMRPGRGEAEQVERLVEHVQEREGLDRPAARRRVAAYARALVANAVKASRDGAAWAMAFRARCTVGTWAPELYERVVARGGIQDDVDKAAAWRAREFRFDDGREPLRYVEPEPAPAAPSDAVIAEMADAFLAALRAP